MLDLEVVLPIVILSLGFAIKLLIDRTPDLPEMIVAFLELPVDITILALTLVAAYAIGGPPAAKNAALVVFAVVTICAIGVAALWRRSHVLFVKEIVVWAGALAVIEYVICISCLVYSIGLVGEIGHNAAVPPV